MAAIGSTSAFASSTQANYSPCDWQQYQLTGEWSRQLAARVTEITYELKASSTTAPYQQLRVESDWQIRFVRCENRVPTGNNMINSYDFGYGMKQGRWEQLAKHADGHPPGIACHSPLRSSWGKASASWTAVNATHRGAAPNRSGTTRHRICKS